MHIILYLIRHIVQILYHEFVKFVVREYAKYTFIEFTYCKPTKFVLESSKILGVILLNKKLTPLSSILLSSVILLSACASPDAAAGVASPAGEGGGQDVINIRIAHVALEITPIAQAVERFAHVLEERSEGRFNVDIFPNSVLGGNRELIEQLQMGTLEMAAPSVASLGGFTDGTALFDLPYLFDSQEGAFAVFDSEIGRGILDDLLAANIVGLDWYAMGWRNLTANREIRTPEDMQGLRVRVIENQMHIDHFNALGASATPMAFAEVYTSLQQGVIEAQENPYSQIYSQRFYEVQSHIIETQHIFDPVPLIMSRIWWESLTPEDQALIREVSAETVEWQRGIIDEIDGELRDRLMDIVTIIELTPEERAAFRAASQPVYDANIDLVGADVLQRVAEIQAALN